MNTAISGNIGARLTGSASRSKAPVFVLGCPRSGTTVLYHMLLSAGGFAVYRAESNVFNLLAPKFGNLNSSRNRARLLEFWSRSKLFRVSGLDAEEISAKIDAECRSAGDFLRITMRETARKQGVDRWADCTPDHLLYIHEIKRQIPDALIIHAIRDGRDVALSFAQQGWSHPLWWDRKHKIPVAALYWAWIVRQGREAGRTLGHDYIEVRFEDLVGKPTEALGRMGEFIDQDLDYERIRHVAIGSVKTPNTSFTSAIGSGEFNPVGRWKDRLSGAGLSTVESLIGDLLLELGYPLAGNGSRNNLQSLRLRSVYPQLFSLKLWLKNHTPLGRTANTNVMEIDEHL